jgi:hypothetical protein
MSRNRFTYSSALAFTLLTFVSFCVRANTIVAPSTSISYIDYYFSNLYEELGKETIKPNYAVFRRALTGFLNLKAENKIKNNLLTIIDFSLSSTVKRMWVVDVSNRKVVYFSLVAHGVNTGEEFAKSFSNRPSSNQSSLGFYVTDMTYIGKHGRSLYLDGVEQGVNDKARERTIVMHCANYVSEDFIRRNGRLGRSFGCPAIPMKDHEKIITLLAGRSCIYIHYPDEQYLSNSKLLAQEKIVAGLYALFSETLSAYNFYPELCSTADIP